MFMSKLMEWVASAAVIALIVGMVWLFIQHPMALALVAAMAVVAILVGAAHEIMFG